MPKHNYVMLSEAKHDNDGQRIPTKSGFGMAPLP